MLKHTLIAWLAGAAIAAGAQTDPMAGLGPMTQHWLDDAVQRAQPGGSTLRMEVAVGQLDPRLQLAPCAHVEPYLPPNARLWGRTRLGLRCTQGAVAWNVFLPVTIKAWGPAWVVNRNVAPGATLTADDASQTGEVDWAADNSPIIANPEAWIGQVAARQLVPGQALRHAMVKPPQMFNSGAQVRVMVQGPGIAVIATGQALGPGGAGQTVRVRVDNGRIITGTVTEDGTVAVPL
ncbi:MAG: flagellar basal body P-ring formation chaperone FlgA [Acidovorax sp.]